jgi:hypothetical protein
MFTYKGRGIIQSSFYKGFGSPPYSRLRILLRGTAGREHHRPLSSQQVHQNHRPKPQPIHHFRQPELARARMSGRVPIESQRVDAPLTRSATFLVLTVTDNPEAVKTVRSTLADIDGLAKNVSIRDLGASFACTVGIGSDVWDRVTGLPKPAELHPFPAVKGAKCKYSNFS